MGRFVHGEYRNCSHQFNVSIVWIVVKSEVNPVKFFDCIVTGNESWIHYYDFLSQLEGKVWKRSGEQTPTRLRQERSAGNIMMMIIFWNKNWRSAHRVPATWNHDQWSLLCINHRTTAFCHCGERMWQSYPWSAASS